MAADPRSDALDEVATGGGQHLHEAAGPAQVLERLRRIRKLDRERAAPARLLAELRELVAEAEAWARLEGDDRAREAASRLAGTVAAVEEVALGTVSTL